MYRARREHAQFSSLCACRLFRCPDQPRTSSGDSAYQRDGECEGYVVRVTSLRRVTEAGTLTPDSPPVLSNADIADRLASLAQLLSTQKENPYKVKAYQRAAARVRTLSESIDELVREGSDLTGYAGIGEAISGAIREIGILRVYKKLHISSVEALRERLESGEIETKLGARMAQHVRQGLTDIHAMLLYQADDLRLAVEEFFSTSAR